MSKRAGSIGTIIQLFLYVIVLVSMLSFLDRSLSMPLNFVMMFLIPALCYPLAVAQNDGKREGAWVASLMIFFALESFLLNWSFPLLKDDDGTRAYLWSLVPTTGAVLYFLFLKRAFFLGNLRKKFGEKVSIFRWFFLTVIVAALCAVSAMVVEAQVQGINGLLDRSEPEAHQGVILRTELDRGRHTTTYNVYFRGWWEGTDEKIDVTPGFYYSVHTGDTLRFEVKKGLFGLAWIKEYGKI